MLDPANDLMPPTSSPTNSSMSSSDLDTESTGSFFHDRSTTLGTLMGVTFSAISFRAPSRSHSRHRQLQMATADDSGGGGGGGRTVRRQRKNKATAMEGEEERPRWRRRRWWRLCRDEDDLRPSSLGEYLEVERRFGDVAVYGGAAAAAAAEIEGVVNTQPTNGRVLFADGKVLPPADVDGESSSVSAGGGLFRFPVVSLSGICR